MINEIFPKYGSDKLDHDYGPFYEVNMPMHPKKILEIGVLKGADPGLLLRILRYLASHEFIKQTDKELFTANNRTRNLADPRVQAATTFK